MKNFRWAKVSVFILWSLVLDIHLGRASSINADHEVPISKLHLRLSLLQKLWLADQYSTVNASKNIQYVDKNQAQQHDDYLYIFALQVNTQHSSEDYYKPYDPYFDILRSGAYADKVISPMIVRVLGVKKEEGKKENSSKDHFVATYEITHKKWPPFRFHIVLISEHNMKNLPSQIGIDILTWMSRKDSIQLSTLSKKQYFIAEKGITLENLIGKKISEKKKFKRQQMSEDVLPSSTQSHEPERFMSQLDSNRNLPVDITPKPLPLSSLTPEEEKISSPRKQTNVRYTLLGQEIDDLMRLVREGQVGEMSPPESSSSSSSSQVSTAPLSPLSDEVKTDESVASTSSPKRGRNPALVNKSAKDLLAKK